MIFNELPKNHRSEGNKCNSLYGLHRRKQNCEENSGEKAKSSKIYTIWLMVIKWQKFLLYYVSDILLVKLIVLLHC